jgi:hypothetical protein
MQARRKRKCSAIRIKLNLIEILHKITIKDTRAATSSDKSAEGEAVTKTASPFRAWIPS